jgi:hypothetical protein
MLKSKRVCFRELHACRVEARKKIKESLRDMMSDAFWEHARASRRETKLACRAFRRAVKGQFKRAHTKTPATSQTIDIT